MKPDTRRRRADVASPADHATAGGSLLRDDPRSLLAEPRLRVLLGVALTAAAALLCAGLLPRGPITTAEALLALPAALLVGVGAGALIRRRSPAAGHRASFEQPALYTDLLTGILEETA